MNTIVRINFLPNNRVHGSPADVVSTINPTLVTDNVTDVVDAPIKKTVSIDSNVDVSLLNLLNFFFNL